MRARFFWFICFCQSFSCKLKTKTSTSVPKMVSKLLIFTSILWVFVSAQEDDWSCETETGTSCSGIVVASSEPGRRHPFFKGSVEVTCWDAGKQESNNYVSTTTTTGHKLKKRAKCLDRSTPCISDFKVCSQEPNGQTVTLKCRYLREFEQTQNEDGSSENKTTKCGARAANQYTYRMKTGDVTTKIKYNCEKIRIEKPITDDSESTRK